MQVRGTAGKAGPVVAQFCQGGGSGSALEEAPNDESHETQKQPAACSSPQEEVRPSLPGPAQRCC